MVYYIQKHTFSTFKRSNSVCTWFRSYPNQSRQRYTAVTANSRNHTIMSESVITVWCFPVNHGHPGTWTRETLSIHELNIINCCDHPTLEGNAMNHSVVLFVGQINLSTIPKVQNRQESTSPYVPKRQCLKYVPSRVNNFFRSNTNLPLKKIWESRTIKKKTIVLVCLNFHNENPYSGWFK